MAYQSRGAIPYHSRGPIRTAFGRPAAANDSTGLAWIILLVIFAALVTVTPIARSLDLGSSDASGVSRALGWGRPEHIRQGYDPNRATQAHEASAAVPVVAPVPEPARSASPQAEARSDPAMAGPAAGERVRVANTDGLGVVLHTAPQKDARVPRGFLEGARLVLLERSGDWAHVRDESGLQGWVRGEYLAPIN